MIDSSVIRVHQHAAGVKKGGDRCMGRSRGGMSTKTHALVDAEGLPLRIALTPGQASDVHGGDMLLNHLAAGSALLGDKGYDADWIREKIEAQDDTPNISYKSNRKEKHFFSKVLYKERNEIERFLNKIKRLRHVATRYEKLRDDFLAMVKLAAIQIWL